MDVVDADNHRGLSLDRKADVRNRRTRYCGTEADGRNLAKVKERRSISTVEARTERTRYSVLPMPTRYGKALHDASSSSVYNEEALRLITRSALRPEQTVLRTTRE